jgi:hypothetical protein
MIAGGVLLYLGGVGVAGLLLGGNFLDYFVLDPTRLPASTAASSGSSSAWRSPSAA